jgi:hypothetical protein
MKIDISDRERKIINWALRERANKIISEAPAMMRDENLTSDIIPFFRKRIFQTFQLIEKFQKYDT